MRWLALASLPAMLAACTDYAQLSLHDAPGNVDLGKPMAFENGDPARTDPAKDPGSTTIAAMFAPYILGGAGRFASHAAAGEAGFEVHVERADNIRLTPNNWHVTAGMAFAQWSQGVRTIAPGAFYAELGYRHIFGTGFPIDVALGPMLYIDDSSAGAQATLRWYVLVFRTRYVANTGAEVFGGVEIPIPFFFESSK